MLNNGKVLGLNINEILLEEKLLLDEQFLNNLFFDCLCAIFLVDITSEDSLSLIKQLLNVVIIKLNCTNLCKLLVINKVDLIEKRKVSSIELSEYINEFSSEFENLEISVKTKQNLDKLWDKVNEAVNNNSLQIPINLFTERLELSDNEDNIIRAQGSINIILIGDSGVGKSNLYTRYFQNKFEEHFISTIGMDRQTKLIKYNNLIYKVNISDTAGQERFRSLPLRYYQNSDGALLLFDVAKEESFQNINEWIAELNKNSRNLKQSLYLIGNKIDLPNRKVSTKEAKELAEKLQLQYYEISCKINLNINEVIARLIIDCINNIRAEENGFQKKKKKKKNKKCCL